jgi:methylmalonyl-CoA mutase cobalamin-binding subunit
MRKKILGASLGSCVHVAGLLGFLNLCRGEGWEVCYLGPAVPVEDLVVSVKRENPDLVAVSYRLSPDAAGKLFTELADRLKKKGLHKIPFLFGGTPPVAEAARKSGLFSRVFAGSESMEEIRCFLRGETGKEKVENFPSTLAERVEKSCPMPLLRHHFGLSSVEETVRGARCIAEAGVMDILSLGPDQNAQEHFFHPERMDPAQDGAGGVPLRSAEDLCRIYEATRCGNYPLLRCYSGTNDLQSWAEMSVNTIRNAWGVVPLFWYSVLDGRSRRNLMEALRENLSVLRWYAKKRIPIEINESHQWSLRSAHDSLAVAAAFMAAWNARKLGARTYVSQYMFNTPKGTSPIMDLAKMLAKKEMIESLQNPRFRVFTQVRAGLAHFSSDPHVAKGQLAASGLLSLALKPHILHVVGFSEGDHAARPEEVIESCRIIRGMLQNSLADFPDLTLDRRVQIRKKLLQEEACLILEDIGDIANPRSLVRAVERGILDAPDLRGRPPAKGEVATRMIGGACRVVDAESGKELREEERLGALLVKNRNLSPLRGKNKGKVV